MSDILGSAHVYCIVRLECGWKEDGGISRSVVLNSDAICVFVGLVFLAAHAKGVCPLPADAVC